MKKIELEQVIGLIQQQVKTLFEEIAEIKEQITPKPVEAPTLPKVESLGVNASLSIPADFLSAVKTTLNQNFGIQINALPDRPAFELVVSVPKVYSNAPPAHWQTYGGDFRPKIISDAEGINGVRSWLEKVWNNFNQDLKTKIALDRVKLQ